ncbi:hypothetical protein SPRG_19520 [Saprolegnia parasitica CBS 223.65]|uniref:Uncharacterized protein n=1 Tax=Saprolegnia parasitica (strain CBS 223.65) TaxID=695850 RepID=A0A067CR60_SAPPC|nr:hypothetical protein SPRG_19520 [Saprolegnia parasitica CBS 223.65]KDO31705.1 hypothetical protein SPRG_19520 [Saprolegnia parasitica CBS 223.65]|eukprot:XP_012197771.1 hypothetical protein SPRG_19520 [Saprolegnia parasitica CBS 223.65]
MAKVASEQALTIAPMDETRTETPERAVEGETPEGLRQSSSFMNENPWNRPRTGRKIVFVDEQDSGTPLHEITYSKQTHYSRTTHAPPPPTPPNGGCCVIQ